MSEAQDNAQHTECIRSVRYQCTTDRVYGQQHPVCVLLPQWYVCMLMNSAMWDTCSCTMLWGAFGRDMAIAVCQQRMLKIVLQPVSAGILLPQWAAKGSGMYTNGPSSAGQYTGADGAMKVLPCPDEASATLSVA